MILKCQEGDRRAQNELFKLYANAMYNICRRMMGTEDDAKDVLQDSFIHAFTKIKGLRNADTFSAWIKRIVINHCINALKKKHIVTDDLDDHLAFQVQESTEDPDEIKYEARKIMDAIDRISEGCKTVLNLYLFDGYDHKEIAQILNISESASKAQYSKAKAKVRKILAEENSRS
ncbi:MAG: RNA polymerase sigma factor [Cytophagales bacterium]|nr:RNA polymerase sigma factor [Cytophagales bacterium]